MAHATAQFLGSQSQFQRFLNQTLCFFSQMKDIKHIRRDFHSVPWVMPQGLVLGGQRSNFLNMVMWHIKLKGISSRPGYTENVYHTVKLVTLRWGSKTIRFLRERGDLRWRAMECFLVYLWISSTSTLLPQTFAYNLAILYRDQAGPEF